MGSVASRQPLYFVAQRASHHRRMGLSAGFRDRHLLLGKVSAELEGSLWKA